MTHVPQLNPGDRVRIQHDPVRDTGYSSEHQKARQALAGLAGVIRERRIDGTFRVVVPLHGERPASAWFAGDELVSPEAPVAGAPKLYPLGSPPVTPKDALWTLAQVVDDAQVLRAACERLTGTVGLPAPELASALLATVAAELEVGREERARASRAREQARARLHEGDPAAVKP